MNRHLQKRISKAGRMRSVLQYLKLDNGSLMMTLKSNFQQMSRKELRTYVLTHRDDDEALRIYMDRLHNESGVIRYKGGLNEEDFNQLEQAIERRVRNDNT